MRSMTCLMLYILFSLNIHCIIQLSLLLDTYKTTKGASIGVQIFDTDRYLQCQISGATHYMLNIFLKLNAYIYTVRDTALFITI